MLGFGQGHLWFRCSLFLPDRFDLEEHSEDSFRHEETLVADDPFHEGSAGALAKVFTLTSRKACAGQVFWRVPEGDPDAVPCLGLAVFQAWLPNEEPE